MKVLIDHSKPFLLAHGGLQIQIEETKAALQKVGVEVEFVRWWDSDQLGDVIHYFGRPHPDYMESARLKGIKIVMAELLGGLAARSALSHLLQRFFISSALRILPSPFTSRFAWESYKRADAVIALTPYEARLMTDMFDAPPEKVHVVTNGVENVFLESPPTERENFLICTGTIAERKRVVEVAQAAVAAGLRLRVVGDPYSEQDPYYRRFLELTRRHPDLILYEGAIQDREQLAAAYRQARGFVLLSTEESLSLSALEAAACACPLLLSDLPWARTTFGNKASYCPVTRSTPQTARGLRAFYDSAPTFPLPEKPKTWVQIAHDLQRIYDLICKTS